MLLASHILMKLFEEPGDGEVKCSVATTPKSKSSRAVTGGLPMYSDKLGGSTS